MRLAYLLRRLFPLLALAFTLPAAAQIDTTGGKFYRPLYQISTTTGVPYGAAVNAQGATQTLLMDIYQPVDGPAGARPVIILAHGGGFIAGLGSRTSQDVLELCRRFARLGYVTASIDYRLNGFMAPDANTLVRAMHDMRAAVRFFRQDAATANTYRVAPDYLFVGGSSAGAFTALNTAYLDKPSELTLLGSTEPGGVEGQSGNPGYSSATRAAINLCGALGQLGFIEAGNQPFVSLHGTRDTTVPYNAGPTAFNPIAVVYGSGALQPQAAAVGVVNALYPFRGAGHVPYSGTSTAAVAYMDTTFRFVRDFLRPLLVPATAPLPVTLTRFEAARRGADAVLTWQTASEANNDGYEVQVSTNGREFQKIGFVAAGAPSALGPRSYRFVDEAPGKSGRRYYRLRQLDLDGKDSFFGPRVVDFKATQTPVAELQAYPNPFQRALTVRLPRLVAGARLQLHSVQGRVVYSRQLPPNPEPTQLTDDPLLAGLAPGGGVVALRQPGGRAPRGRGREP